jgi:hypothetical protein
VLGFGVGGGFELDASGCQTRTVEDHLALGRRLIALAEAGTFDRSLLVVTELVAAQSLLVLISGAEGGEVELQLRASADALLPGLDEHGLASLSGHAEIGRQAGMQVAIIRQGTSTPLFSARRIRRRLIGRAVFRMDVGGGGADNAAPEEQDELALALPHLE